MQDEVQLIGGVQGTSRLSNQLSRVSPALQLTSSCSDVRLRQGMRLREEKVSGGLSLFSGSSLA